VLSFLKVVWNELDGMFMADGWSCVREWTLNGF